ncbi:MAG: PEP-CTERM sorting domain-containing protein [Gemmataceae bacterium]|nr:PEP-CTERM sorting domain-containing protein [Gemmataceae bacterium]MCI0739182.1 PEP-CTERM sorting domain-containing protein [Gemmataceae bacterium]
MFRYIPVALCLAALASTPFAARADYVAQIHVLDQSNTFKDGVYYGSVVIEAYDGVGDAGGGLSAGQVRITFTADPLSDYGVRLNFGFDKVGFGTDLALKSSQISAPFAWKMKSDEQLDGFGRFTWVADQFLPHHRLNTIALTISGLGMDATLEHFLIASANKSGHEPPQGASYFAGRVGGFVTLGDGKLTFNHFVGAPALEHAPEPSTLALAGLACCCLGLVRLARRRKA